MQMIHWVFYRRQENHQALGREREPEIIFDQVLGGRSRPRPASLKLLSGGERDHEVDGRDLSSDDGLRTKVFGEVVENLL